MTWEFIRITGLVALAFLTVSVALGVAGPALHRPTSRLASVSMHMTAAVGGTVLVIAHIIFAIADSWVSVPAMAAIVPGASTWEPLWIAVGTIAFDLMLVMVATSALRQQAPGLWKRAHILAYPVWALVWVHTLAVGSDAGTPLMVGMAAASAALVAAAFVLRRMRPLPRPVPVAPKELEYAR
jgi:DMSO/TMAO reductase YedYZ heme-binding membrane subunit